MGYVYLIDGMPSAVWHVRLHVVSHSAIGIQLTLPKETRYHDNKQISEIYVVYYLNTLRYGGN